MRKGGVIMIFQKKKNQEYNEMEKAIQTILPHNAKLINFEISSRYFSNMIVHIESNGIVHKFTTRRGTIYHNDQELCDSSYHYTEKEDTFPKLLEIIKEVLF